METRDLLHEAFIGLVDLVVCKVGHNLVPFLFLLFSGKTKRAMNFFMTLLKKYSAAFHSGLFLVFTQVQIPPVGGGIPQNTSRHDGPFWTP